MAITVELKIIPKDVTRKEANIIATYTDSEDPSNPKIITFASALLADNAQKTAVLDNIAAHYEALVAKQSAIDAFIADMEITGAANLEARL